MILMYRAMFADIPLDVYLFLNIRFHIVFLSSKFSMG